MSTQSVILNALSEIFKYIQWNPLIKTTRTGPNCEVVLFLRTAGWVMLKSDLYSEVVLILRW